MPHVDGIAVCEFISQAGGDIPVLMLTASHERATRAAALEAGANAYLTKPFALDQLLAHVRRLFAAFPMLPSVAESVHAALLH
jgi:DNA-binding response OmpR family regulator